MFIKWLDFWRWIPFWGLYIVRKYPDECGLMDRLIAYVATVLTSVGIGCVIGALMYLKWVR